MPDNLRVPGYCPMGCGRTLECRGTDGAILCQATNCPRPYAVRDLLADRETEHVVQFDTAGFTIRHPLRERLDDELMRCGLHSHCSHMSGPLDPPGRYRAVLSDDGHWIFHLLEVRRSTHDGV
ncbi:DUF6085 family protein [Streptomyces cylindrosporus]|uniref:DUF6085 family protein n=1 Tax=Streptomyces cylindrosporus TaxID=2927583 RepID=A0ABS9YJS0_9ACTN|nr:DUF6085 family protein [Streptomyces cylindrosporus]MCI3277492.1 DUF6085 family protein [Streptomyces cylindrosporus]